MKSKRNVALTVGLFAVIALLLSILLILIPSEKEPAQVSESDDYRETVGDEEPAEPTEPVGVTEGDDTPPKKKEIYIVIDDVGNSLAELERFLSLPVMVTFALMPERPYTTLAARKIRQAGFDVILHQPMEPEGGQNPGAGAIYTDMNADEVADVLGSNLAPLTSIGGMNNHMGSKATADPATMKAIMLYLKKHGMFFLDSVTTDKSVAEKAAEEIGVPFARRSSMFLDNEQEKTKIEKAFLVGVDLAAKTGKNIMIGHVKSDNLAEIIEEQYKGLEEKGFTFLGMSEYFSLN